MSALSRETLGTETLEMPDMDRQKLLKQLSVRTKETLKRLRSAGVGQWWLVWVSGARQWVLGSSKATNAVCLAVFDPVTFCALSQMAEFTFRPRLIATVGMLTTKFIQLKRLPAQADTGHSA